MEWQARSTAFRVREAQHVGTKEAAISVQALAAAPSAPILTAALALKRQRWISWFSGVEGEVWLHVCWVVVEQPEQIKGKHTEK